MSRRRYLSTDAGRDKALRDVARQSMFAHSFYLLAIPCAGDDCTLPTNDPDELLWEVWPSMARDYTTEDVEAAIELLVSCQLWEYAPDGRLRYPPGSYYKHQTYIREDRRGAAKGNQAAEQPRNAPEPAHDSLSIEGVAQNSAEQRRRAQKGASFSSSFSSSSSVSSSPSPTTAVDRVAPDAADAVPDAPLLPVVVAQLAVQSEHQGLWDAFTDVFGQARGKTEGQRRGEACKRAGEARASPDEIRLAAEHWPNVMGDATLTELGIVANLGKLLHGPQVNGRSSGVTRSVQQTLRQTATVPPDDMAALRAFRARKAH